MDCLKVGLQEHVPSAVILQVFPQASLVDVTEKEVTDIISNDKSVEEVVAVEVNTISELRDTLQPKDLTVVSPSVLPKKYVMNFWFSLKSMTIKPL